MKAQNVDKTHSGSNASGTMAIEALSVVPDRSRVRGLVREKRFRADVGMEDVIEEVQAFVEDM